MRNSRWSNTTSTGVITWSNLWYWCILLHGSNLIFLSKCLLSSLLSRCNILGAIGNWRAHGTIHMNVMFSSRDFIQQDISNPNPLCSSNLKDNVLQQSWDEKSERKFTMTEGKISIGSNGVDDDLFDIELLSWEDVRMKWVVNQWISIWWDKE